MGTHVDLLACFRALLYLEVLGSVVTAVQDMQDQPNDEQTPPSQSTGQQTAEERNHPQSSSSSSSSAGPTGSGEDDLLKAMTTRLGGYCQQLADDAEGLDSRLPSIPALSNDLYVKRSEYFALEFLEKLPGAGMRSERCSPCCFGLIDLQRIRNNGELGDLVDDKADEGDEDKKEVRRFFAVLC